MIQDKIISLIKPVIEAMGYELWWCEYKAQGRQALLRIFIDGPAGIGIEDCQRVSHQVQGVLDVEDPIEGHYNLEISSPGIPRPLFSQEHFQRYVGSSVQIRLQRPWDGKRNILGIIQSVETQHVVLTVEGVEQNFMISNIQRANLVNE